MSEIEKMLAEQRSQHEEQMRTLHSTLLKSMEAVQKQKAAVGDLANDACKSCLGSLEDLKVAAKV